MLVRQQLGIPKQLMMHCIDRAAVLLVVVILFMVQINIVETKNLPNMVDAADSMIPGNTFEGKVPNDRTVLSVALFPYLPDSVGDGYKSLLSFIKDEFEKQFPSYSLKLRPINPLEDFYNLTVVTKWLTDASDLYDIVEVDTVILGDLVNAGLIAPQIVSPVSSADWHPVAVAAVQFNQAYYAFPHLLCSFFLFTRAFNIAKAKTIDELVSSIGNTATTRYRLVGNLDSSWDLPSLWIDSFRDTYYPLSHDEAEALHDYQNYPFESLRKLARLCDVLGRSNPCIDGTFRNKTVLTKLFAQGQAAAMLGYSERLFHIIKDGFWNDINNVKVMPLPLGTFRNEPVFFTDAFVFRRGMPNNVRYAANAFVHFMASPRIQAVVVGSGDNPAQYKIPRYLLPISKAAYDDPLLASDTVYQQIFRNLTGVPLPTAGYHNTRKTLQAAILKFIN